MKIPPPVIKAAAVAGAAWLLWWLWNNPRRVTRETYIEANVLNPNFGLLVDDQGNPVIPPSTGFANTGGACRCMNPTTNEPCC